MKKTNEKQVSARLKGFNFADYETHNIKGIDLFNYAMMKLEEEKKVNPLVYEQMKLKSEIRLIKNRIHEKELDLFADTLLLEKLEEKLNNMQGFNDVKRDKLISAINIAYDEFMSDDKLDDSIKSDITKFYEIKRADIDIVRMELNLDSFEDAINIYESYLAENENTSIMDTPPAPASASLK